jgi:hypothetical protein
LRRLEWREGGLRGRVVEGPIGEDSSPSCLGCTADVCDVLGSALVVVNVSASAWHGSTLTTAAVESALGLPPSSVSTGPSAYLESVVFSIPAAEGRPGLSTQAILECFLSLGVLPDSVSRLQGARLPVGSIRGGGGVPVNLAAAQGLRLPPTYYRPHPSHSVAHAHSCVLSIRLPSVWEPEV